MEKDFLVLKRASASRSSGEWKDDMPRGAASCLIIPYSSAPTLSNNITQKGLAFGRDWSGSVVNSGR